MIHTIIGLNALVRRRQRGLMRELPRGSQYVGKVLGGGYLESQFISSLNSNIVITNMGKGSLAVINQFGINKV